MAKLDYRQKKPVIRYSHAEFQMMTLTMKLLRKSLPVLRTTLQYGSLQPWPLKPTVPKPAPCHLPAPGTSTNTQKDHQIITAQSPLWIITNTHLTKITTNAMTGGRPNTAGERRELIPVPAITKGTGIQHPARKPKKCPLQSQVVIM
jgi:hypothetical protein